MAVTKSWESKVLALPGTPGAPASRIGWREFAWLAAASVLVSAGLVLVYAAKTAGFNDLARPFVSGRHRVGDGDDVLAAVELVVRVADADRAHAHEDFIGCDRRR